MLLASHEAWGFFSLTPNDSLHVGNLCLIPFKTNFHLIALSNVLRLVDLCLPYFIYHLGVQLRASLGIQLGALLRKCINQRRRRFLIVVWICSEFFMAWKSKFEMVLRQKIRKILRRHPFWKHLWNKFVLCWASFKHVQPIKNML